MRTSDINRPLTAHALNENMYKQFNVRINFDKYDRAQLENYRNLLRTKISQQEHGSNFNDLLTNETYQRDKYMLGVLNTRIKEMLGEAKVMEKKLSKGETKKKEEIVKSMKKSKGDFKKRYGDRGEEVMYATATKLAKKKADESVEEGSTGDYSAKKAAAGKDIGKSGKQFAKIAAKAEKGGAKSGAAVAGAVLKKLRAKEDVQAESAKPDFLDMDKDGNKTEPMKKAVKDKKKNPFKKTTESAKPDFLDMDKDGNKKETMKKAVKDKAAKKKVKESMNKTELIHRAYQKFISESVATYIAEDEEGKAKSITAAADMVNDFTSWMQRVGNYQTKSMIELADNIRANFGMQEAETFKQSVGAALEEALNALTQAREQINNAVAVLAGEAPAQEPMGMEPGAEAPGEFGGPAAPDEMNVPGEDEFAASDAAAGGPETTGRVRRESIERGNRLMKILGS